MPRAGSVPRLASRLTCTTTAAPSLRPACALDSTSPGIASCSMETLPSSSAVDPLSKTISRGKGLNCSHSLPSIVMSSTKSSLALALCRPPSCRGSTKVWRPTRLIRPGLPAAISRVSWAITPCGRVYDSILLSRASSTSGGESTSAPVMLRFNMPGCRNLAAPFSLRSPMPTAWMMQRSRGAPISR